MFLSQCESSRQYHKEIASGGLFSDNNQPRLGAIIMPVLKYLSDIEDIEDYPNLKQNNPIFKKNIIQN